MNILSFIDIATYISLLVLFIGVLIGLFYYRYLDKVDRLLLIFLLVSLIVDFLSHFTGVVHLNNLIPFVLIGLTDLFIFAMIYIHLSGKKVFIRLISFIGVFFAIFEMIYAKPDETASFQPYSKVVASFLIVAIVLSFLFETMYKDTRSSDKGLTFHSLVLFYFSIELVLLLPLNFLIHGASELTLYFRLVHILMSIIFNLYLSHFIWKNGRKQRL